jgi:endonuclease/exonuclease/phosphatase family metal-dependent hydrolase
MSTRILALAPIVVGCTPRPVEPPAAPTSGTFTALTYNVQGLPDALTDSDRPTEERMVRISPLLDGYDVVLVQEDFDPAYHALLVSEATHPTAAWFDAIVAPDRVYGSGLASLARVGERVDVFQEHYTTCSGVLDGASDCLASKGFLVLRLSLGGAELDVYDTHHEAGGGPEDLAARSAQVDQVLASMETLSEGRAVLLGGDTNLRWSDPEDVPLLQRYADAGLRDACDEVGCPEPDHIDRFLLRDGPDLALNVSAWGVPPEFVDELGEDLSDHPPISATFRWE